MFAITRKLIRAIPAPAVVGCLVLMAACHDANRDNALDPELTPAVELLSVTTDPQAGTAALSWTSYAGDQPFGSYRISRRLSGQAESEVRGTVSDPSTTTFTDVDLEVDRTYVYEVTVLNAAGLAVQSNTQEVGFTLATPNLQLLELNSLNAQAVLSWDRSQAGFVHYEIQRQIGTDPPIILATIDDIERTTFVDPRLLGNTDYRYTVTTRTTTGRELPSSVVTGKFHGLLDTWGATEPRGKLLKSFGLDAEGNVYVSMGSGLSIFAPAPKVPDDIIVFTPSGDFLRRFPSDPSASPIIFEASDIAVGPEGIYVLQKGERFDVPAPAGSSSSEGPPGLPPGPPPGFPFQLPPGPPPGLPTDTTAAETVEVIGTYVNAFSLDGSLQFRWPETDLAQNIASIAVTPEGTVLLAQADVDSTTGDPLATFIELDPITGGLLGKTQIGEIEIFPFFTSALSVNSTHIALETSDGIGAFDRGTGAVVPNLTSQLTSDVVGDLSLGPDGRLYVFSSDPERIDILSNWEALTSLPLDDGAGVDLNLPALIGLDSNGQIVVVDEILNTHTFAE